MSCTLLGKEISLKIKVKECHPAFQAVFRWECSTLHLNVTDQPLGNAQVNGLHNLTFSIAKFTAIVLIFFRFSKFSCNAGEGVRGLLETKKKGEGKLLQTIIIK